MGKKATLLNCPGQSWAYVRAETPPGAKEQWGYSFCHHSTETQKELSSRRGITSEMWNTRRNARSVEVQSLTRTGNFLYFLISANGSRAYSLFFQLVQQPSLMINFFKEASTYTDFFRKNSCETTFHATWEAIHFMHILPPTRNFSTHCARQRATSSSQFASLQVINPGFQCMEIEHLTFPIHVWYPKVP